MAGYFGLLDTSIGKNSFYRFINNERYDWRKLQYGVAKAYVKNVKKETKANSATKHDVEELKFYVADGHHHPKDRQEYGEVRQGVWPYDW